jgi:osmoprotectant transport system permease protein
MSTWSAVWDWLTAAGHYRGPDGVPHRLLEHAGISFEAIAIAAAISLPLGIVTGHVRRFGGVVTVIANASRAIPVIGVLIILAVGPLGVGRDTAVVALVIFAIPPILTNTYTGVRNVDDDVRESAVGMGMNNRQVMLRAEIPLALPLIAAGFRLAAIQVWATATLAAIVGSGGLGQFIVVGYGLQDYGQLYGGVIYIGLTAVLLEGAFAMIERWLGRRLGQSRPVVLADVGEPAAQTVVTA